MDEKPKGLEHDANEQRNVHRCWFSAYFDYVDDPKAHSLLVDEGLC